MKTISPTGWRRQSGHEKIDSDREVLPFPSGGVLALKVQPAADTPPADLAARLLGSIDLMQARIDQLQSLINEDLEADLDTIAGHIGRAQDFPPNAA